MKGDANADRDPLKSQTYQSGMGSLRDLLKEQMQAGQGRAAAVGLPGSELTKSNQAGALKALTEGQRGLLGQASQLESAKKRNAQAALLQLLGMNNANEQAGKNRTAGLLGTLGSAGVTLATSGLFGGPSSKPLVK